MATLRRMLAVSILPLPLIAAPSIAQTAPEAPPATELPPVSVTATRGARPIEDVPATVTLIENTEMERRQATRMQDVVRYEPGISVGNQPARGGSTSYVIRGIGGNRVRIQIDGVRVQETPASNIGPGNYTRDFVDLETLRQVEIVRSPASALYGSDAIGGVVAYTTRDPGDYLHGERDVYISGKAGYGGADSSWQQTILGAARQGPLEVLLQYTHRTGHELDANGSLAPNPQDTNADSMLGRVVYRPTDADTLRLTGEFLRREVDTDIRTEQSPTVISSTSDDSLRRTRVQLDYIREAPVLLADRMEARVYYSTLIRREMTWQSRKSTATAPAVNRLRFSDFRVLQDVGGGEVQFDNRFAWLGMDHRLTYGAALDWTWTSRPRFRNERNLVTGTSTTTVAGENYPSKNFPDSTTWQGGLYVQDEARIGALSIIPAIRFDYYRLSPTDDADFRRSTTVAEIHSQTETAVSPKLGAVYRLDERFSVYGQYARGFRAPPYDSVNFGFTNPTARVEILPSGNLKPEKSNSFEAGLRGRFGEAASFQIAGFYNTYTDFIESVEVGLSPSGFRQFQARNFDNVTIYGAEARGDWRFLPQWTVRGAFAWARGENDDTGEPLDSVDPVRINGGIAWQHPSGLGAEAVVTHAWRHSRVSDPSYFRAPSYTVLDLMVHWDIGTWATINAGVFNVTDEKYFNSQDTIGLASNSQQIDLYAQPGRYFAGNVTLRW